MNFTACLGVCFQGFKKFEEQSVKFSFRFIYLECYILRCWLFTVYFLSGRENNFINQHYLLYLSCIFILMSWSGFTPISELKGWCDSLCNFKGATKLFFMHYLCVVIILFFTDLYKSAFCTYFYKKSVFFLYVLCLLSDLF